MNKIERQQTNVTHLMELIKENPVLRIMPIVYTDIVTSDDFAWWMGGWGKAELIEIYIGEERIYLRDDEDELIDEVAVLIQDIEGLTEEESYQKAETEVKNYPWEQIIAVRITLPY